MAKNNGSLTANLVQVAERRIVKAELSWSHGVIRSVQQKGSEQDGLTYLIPGFVDAHVHIESSLLIPSEFARIAVRHGSIGCICDPHEIANVLGIPGIRFMLDNARKTPFHFLFGAPGCVPSTAFESSGAQLDAAAIERLLGERGIGFLAEMMNVPGVLARDPSTLAKIAAARRNGRPVDGHAPGLRGAALREYAAAGITTDHECTTLEEALEKIACGMHIQIREGTAARNFDALHPLIRTHTDRVMFCSDDIHPDALRAGHIDRLAARAIAEGHDVFDVLRCACINPARHYRLPVGQLREGDPMDAVELADLTGFGVSRTWLGGIPAFQDGACSLERISATAINHFHASAIAPEDLAIVAAGDTMKIIEVIDGDLCSGLGHARPKVVNGRVVADPERDILLLCVLNRYRRAPPAVAFVRGFGLWCGALASSVAHDSHNIIAVGTDATVICAAINAVVRERGALATAGPAGVNVLPLPMAGLMSLGEGEWVAARYAELGALARAFGCRLDAPFMALSFLAMLVVPELKLSDRGLFDARQHRFTGLFT